MLSVFTFHQHHVYYRKINETGYKHIATMLDYAMHNNAYV